MGIEIKGMAELQKKLESFAKDTEVQILQALEESGQQIVDTAKKNCPVDTGNLQSTIQYKIVNGELIVFSDCDYASAVELGTQHQKAQPFMYSAIEEETANVSNNISDALKRAIGGV